MEILLNRWEPSEPHHDDTMWQVRVEVLDFYRKLDPYAFQDWITSLEDYFDWFGITNDPRVHFIKMKLKGQVRMWWQSVEEQLHWLRQPPITDWGRNKNEVIGKIFTHWLWRNAIWGIIVVEARKHLCRWIHQQISWTQHPQSCIQKRTPIHCMLQG